MASRKKSSLPFDQRRGRVVMQKIVLESEAYLSLSPQAKVLMTLMHMHWSNFKPVDYGVAEARKKIPCAKGTAIKAFKQLQDRGLIDMIDQSIFNSRTGSKTRTWRLTWLPYKSEAPTNEWEEWDEKINPIGSNLIPVDRRQVSKINL